MKPSFLFLILGMILGSVPHLPAQAVATPAALPETPQVQSIDKNASSQTPAGQTSSSSTTSTAAQNAQANTQQPPVSSADQLKAEKKQRILGIVPAFNTVQSGEALPLTKGQKFDLWFHASIDPFTFVTAGIDAGIEQAEDTYPGYHQGALGFAKRYAASYTDSVDGNLWGNAVLPSLLHQDPRYFRLGHGTYKRRLWYAAISTVRCKDDDGRWAPNYSNMAGNLIAGAISNLYYPSSDRGVGLIFERGFTVTAEGALGSLAYEFYPDAIAYLRRRHHNQSTLDSTNPSQAAIAPSSSAIANSK